jgi:SAM-dependent methyltransferase
MSQSPKIIGSLKTSIFRQNQNSLLRQIARDLVDVRSVINIGSVQHEEDKEGQLYKSYFPDAQYFTLDKNRLDSHPLHFALDLHDLAAMNQTFDLILVMSVLEHVKNPFEVMQEIKSISHPGTFLYICTPFFYPIHKDIHARYSDYWRFTDDSLRELCKDWQEIWIREFPSVITEVQDRAMYWDNPSLTPVGYGSLFKMLD